MQKFLSTILVLSAFLVLPAAAQEQGYPFRLSNFKFEFYGGFAMIKPADLNMAAGYEEAYLQFFYIQRYQALAPQGYEISLDRTGDKPFRSIDRATPWGARLKYELSPTLALAIGIQYLIGGQDSSVALSATLRDPVKGIYTDRYDNPGFGLSLKSWLPQLGAYFGWNIGPVFRTELFIAGGPIFTEIRSVNDVHRSLVDWSGFRSDSSVDVEIKGRARTWAAELGGVLRIRPAKRFDIFAEASYAMRQVQELEGQGQSVTTTSDSSNLESTKEASWNGVWRLVSVTSIQSWGKFGAMMPYNLLNWNSDFRKFVLHLSGFQLKLGLSIRL